MRTIATLTTIATAFLLLAPMALADTKTYVGFAAGTTSCPPGATVPVPGEACFRVPAGSASAEIQVIDAVLGPVPFTWSTGHGTNEVCTGSATVALPAGAFFVRVQAGGNLVACGVSPATTGTVTVTWH